MSKFFKWLKKDKQQQESSVDNITPDQTADEQATLESKPTKNESSPIESTIATSHNSLQQEPPKSSTEFEPQKPITPEVEAVSTTKENIHSYKERDAEGLLQSQQTEVKLESTPQISEATSVSHSTQSSEKISSNENASEGTAQVLEQESEQQAPDKTGFFNKLKRGLSRTKESIGSGFVSLFRGKAIDDDLFEELETQLLVADVGMDTTVKVVKQLTDSSNRKQLKDGEALYQLLKEQMADILKNVESPLTLETDSGPFVILMVGVNGVGKTTTIGKMAKQFQQQGKKVMLAAGDTFRAAAVEQLQVWGERNNIPVVAQQTGSDSASVIFDAFESAKAKNIDVLIADTAGRLQNKEHLMEELKKVVRVMKKITPEAPHEIMLTLDAGTGQNALSQTKLFNDAVGLTGLSLTKLDGTAKGGVIFGIADQFNIPIRYVGIGEGIDDLRPFNSQDFVNALFSEPDNLQQTTN
ncbi:signal recognition particle-docking protein FtsY [uncultured Paraglaciecola sp.]|uniref:signal recognition particle-docking protein FtsY n=1 Tax=uncultured Paraglaciecola sp. TaxID=1765024 RepID=UPI00262E983F|nr:signal recognition particle-docking protein FtsY [uncultured Paraglaciecola sp.]